MKSDGGRGAMNILVFNCGSSSLKYKFLRMPGEEEIVCWEAQGVGPPPEKNPKIVHRAAHGARVVEKEMPTHACALIAIDELLSGDGAPKPDAIGHRIVHGGGVFTEPVIVSEAILKRIA